MSLDVNKMTKDQLRQHILMLAMELTQLEKENKKLKEKLSEVTMVADDEKQSIEHILELEEENKKLKAELEFYKKQYEHSMGED